MDFEKCPPNAATSPSKHVSPPTVAITKLNRHRNGGSQSNNKTIAQSQNRAIIEQSSLESNSVFVDAFNHHQKKDDISHKMDHHHQETTEMFVVQQQQQEQPISATSTLLASIKAHETIKASESVSSGLDASTPDEDNAANNDNNNYCSPVSTPGGAMYSPSSATNFGLLPSPRLIVETKQANNASLMMINNQQTTTNTITVEDELYKPHHSTISTNAVEPHQSSSSYDDKIIKLSIPEHDSELITGYKRKSFSHSHQKQTPSDSGTHVNNHSSPAIIESSSATIDESASHVSSSSFHKPLERASTSPSIVHNNTVQVRRKSNPPPMKHASSSKHLSKYGHSAEYKSFIKQTLKLKETGDMRVRGISLKYEAVYHEFLEEAIPQKTFINEMNQLNEFLKNNEPGTKYCCLGFTFFCCTLGLSMIPFAYQLSHFENSVLKYLEELNKKYSNAHLKWQLIQSYTPTDETYITVSLEKEIHPNDLAKLQIS